MQKCAGKCAIDPLESHDISRSFPMSKGGEIGLCKNFSGGKPVGLIEKKIEGGFSLSLSPPILQAFYWPPSSSIKYPAPLRLTGISAPVPQGEQ